MKWLRLLIRKVSYGIQNRIFFPLAIFYIVLVMIMSAVSVFYINDTARKENEESLTSLSKQMAGSFDNYIDSLKDSLVGLISNSASTVSRIINQDYDTDAERYSAYYSFYGSASALLRLESFDTNQIYLVNPSDNYILSSDAYFKMPQNQPPEWAERIRSGPAYMYYHYLLDFQAPKPLQDQYCYAVAINASLFSSGYMEREAFLVMVVGRSRMRYAIKQLDDMLFDSLVIFDDRGEVVYHHRSREEDSFFIEAAR